MIRSLSILACLALSACSTIVYGPDGHPQFRTYANATDLTFNGPGTSFHADTLNHSVPTRAAGKIIGTLGSDVVAAIVPGSGIIPTVGRAAVATAPHLSTTP